MQRRMLGFLLFCILAFLSTTTAFGQDTPTGDGVIFLQAGAFDPLQQQGVDAADVDAATAPYHLVQFAGPVEGTWLEQVAALGGEVLGYIPNDTHVVRMDAATATRVQRLPGVRWVGPYRASYKISPALLHQYMEVGAAASEPVDLTVIAFAGEPLATVGDFLRGQGAIVAEAADTPIGPVLRVTAPIQLFPVLTQHPAISWVERFVQPTTTNAEGRKLMGAEAVWQSFGYFGAGQIVAISDSGLSVQGALSADFAGRLVRGFAPSEMNLASPQCRAKTTYTDLNGHGTHVAGSVLGSGVRSNSNPAAHDYNGSNAGIAPEAQMVFMALNTDGSTGIQCIDLNGDFIAKGYQEGARISTNSWGSNNGGAYTQLSSLVDDYIWRHKDYLVLYSAGNAGPGAQTIGSPGTAKNVLTVGASENNRPDKGDEADNPNSMAGFSSRGPTADGRLKPDVVAPGTWILSVRGAQAPDGSFWGNFNADYAYMGGTSMATPLTAGGATVVREWLNKARGVASPSAALLKAILINGATQLPGENVASNNSGHGRVDLKNTLSANYVIMDDYVQGLTTSGVVTYTVQVVAAGAQGTLFAAGGDAAGAVQASGAFQLTAAMPVMAASVAITTPGELRGEALPGFDQARPHAPIQDDQGGGKSNLAPLPNVAPSPGARLSMQELPASTGHFRPLDASQGPAVQDFRQHMIGGGDFEDPDWSDYWQYVWLGSGVPVRTSNPAFVVSGQHSMWLGGTPLDDALFYPIQFPETIAADFVSEIAFSVRIVDQDVDFDYLCVALIDASGYFLGPYAPDQPECIDANGRWNYNLIFDQTDRADLAGQTAYLAVFTIGDGVEPHMSAFVDDIVLIIDFAPVTAAITPSAGPPGTTFLLTGKHNVPYGWVDICISPCSLANYITTVWADAAGDIAAFLYSSESIDPGVYPIQTFNVGGRTAETGLTISDVSPPTLAVTPTSGPAGAKFSFAGSNFLPGEQTIEVTLNGEVLGSVGSNNAGEVAFTIETATNTQAGSYTVRATDSAGRTADTTFSVTAVAVGAPKLTVAPASGPPGTIFTFAATDFTASTPATVSLDGQALGQVNIDATGKVTLTLETNNQTAPGKYTLAITQDAQSASAQYEVIGEGGAPLSGEGLYVTLAWTDPPAQTAAGQALVNDLDLFVDGPGGRVFANGGATADRRNNVEAVRIQTPAAGTYVITVQAHRVNASFGAQPFAVVTTSKQNFGAGQNTIELGETNGGVLNGVVFADLDRNGVRGPSEPGLAGAQVIVRQKVGALSRQTTTSAAGAYQATGLPAGDYAIIVVLPAGYELTTAETVDITVTLGTNTAPAIGAAETNTGAQRLYLPTVTR
ncbi:MAG: S8 family serine peptidase [Caldilinea sp.]